MPNNQFDINVNNCVVIVIDNDVRPVSLNIFYFHKSEKGIGHKL